MTHSLVFDDAIELIDDEGVVSEGPFWFSTLADVSWGEPQPVEVALNSLLRDGGLVETDSDGNREVSLLVEVQSSDPIGLGQGVALLHRATGKRTTLKWLPPGMDVRTVFRVETSSLGNPSSFDDLAFLKHKQVFRLRLVCLPYTFSDSLTTEVAEGIPSVGTIVNAGTSLTGWSTPTATVPGPSFGSQVPASPQPANMLAVDGTSVAAKAYQVDATRYVGALGASDALQVRNSQTLTQAISIPTGAYLSFEVKLDVPIGRTLTSFFNETYQETGVLDSFEVAAGSNSRTYKKFREQYADRYLFSQGIIEALADGWTRYTFRIDAAMAITALTWTGRQFVPYTQDYATAARPRIMVRNVAVAETATLGKQALKVSEIGGSARTIGSLHIAAPSDSVALGQVLAYSVPQSKVANGFRPDLRQWVDPGATTATVGGRSVLSGVSTNYGSSGSPTFTAPASMFQPGPYMVAGDLYGPAGLNTLTIEATLLIGGVVASTREYPLTYRVDAANASRWRLCSLGTIYLPPTAVSNPGASATVRIRLKSTAGVSVDELFVLPTAGDLTIIDCGEGAVGPNASSHLWIIAPAPENDGRGAYLRGATPTRANAISAHTVRDLTVRGQHVLSPEPMLTVVRAGVQGPTMTAEYPKAWFGHAPE